jgi:D-tyrosyl-tRNA(Tyr) deacylase
LVLQRVKSARVEVAGRMIAGIDQGILAFVGFGHEDESSPKTMDVLPRMARKLVQARIFPDDLGRLNLSLEETQGEVLAVSQFTLHADCRKGRRPSLHPAADPTRALDLFNEFVQALRQHLSSRVHTGSFGAEMDVILHNWGPLTLYWDSKAFCNYLRSQKPGARIQNPE